MKIKQRITFYINGINTGDRGEDFDNAKALALVHAKERMPGCDRYTAFRFLQERPGEDIKITITGSKDIIGKVKKQ